MNLFEKFLYFLQKEMTEPQAFGWFHWLCIVLTISTIAILFLNLKKYNEKQLKLVLGIYAIPTLILEILKQLIWSFNYDSITNIITWKYQWYAFPFQLCSMPIYICLICLFLKKSKLRDSLLSFIAYITILGSISTIIMPDSCLVKSVLVNIHTMYLHMGSFVVSIYLIMTNEVNLKIKNIINAGYVFLGTLGFAQLFNILIYNSGVLNGETFNMFFISPYFISSLPILDIIQKNVPYFVYLFIYIVLIMTGSVIIFGIFKFFKLINKKISIK